MTTNWTIDRRDRNLDDAGAEGPQESFVSTTAGRARRLLSGAVSALVLASLVMPTGTAHAEDSPLCASEMKNQVADVTERLRNWADIGTDGHVWALTEDDVRIRVWQVGSNHYCVRRDIHGTFRAFAGISPNLTGTVSAGVTGTEDGTDWAVLTGNWSPRVPVSGFVGDVDLGCTQTGDCALHRGPAYLFFADDVKALHVRQFDLAYDGGDHGIRRESSDVSTGDITG
jgi:hypothetical protein